MALRIFIFLALALISPLAYAQGKDVQVNLEVLEHYAPPPMFGAEDAPKPKVAAKPAKKAVVERDLQEKDIVQPTASEILKSIETMEKKHATAPKKKTTPEQKRVYTGKMDQNDKALRVRADESIKTERVKAERASDVVKIEPEYKLSVPLDAANAGDLPQVREILLPKLKNSQSTRLEIRSFANGDAAKAGDARRHSLSQALEVKKFLVSQGIDARRIDVMPLGDEAGALKQGRFDFTVRPL